MSTKASDREKRRAAALRENLKRRKTAGRRPDATPSNEARTAPKKSSDGPNTAQKPQ
jgi:hypothetical protein